MRTAVLICFMLFLAVPAYAGGLEDGELFGHKLGEVYVPKRLIQDPEDKINWEVYEPSFMQEGLKQLGLVYMLLYVNPESYTAFKIYAISRPSDWGGANAFAEGLAREFNLDPDDRIENSLFVETVPNSVLKSSIVYMKVFGNRFGLVIMIKRAPFVVVDGDMLETAENAPSEVYNALVIFSVIEHNPEFCDSMQRRFRTESKVSESDIRGDFGRCGFFYDE